MKEITLGHIGFYEGMDTRHLRIPFKEGFRNVDWELVKTYILENEENIESVKVGLAEDWTHTQAFVFEEGMFKERDELISQFHGRSFWATPSMQVFFKNGEDKAFECWKIGEDRFTYFEEGEEQ